MARLYTSKRGSSGSTRPVSKKPPSWLKYTSDEAEALVGKLAKEGNAPSVLGQILRDQYGIPLFKALTGKTISQSLNSSGVPLTVPEDLAILLKKANALRKHLEKHPADYSNKRAVAMVESKIHRLARYYRSGKVLPSEWSYKAAVASVS